MRKYLWLVAGLTFLGVLAFTVWQRSFDSGVETEGGSAPTTSNASSSPSALRSRPAPATAAVDTRPGKQEDAAPSPSDPRAKPAQAPESTAFPTSTTFPTGTASRFNAPSPASNDSDLGEPRDPDVRWQAAAGLPAEVRDELGSSDDPGSRELLQRNNRLGRPRPDDTWGPEMQSRLNEFFESLPESANMLITVACRETQCQVQTVDVAQSAAGSPPRAQALFDELVQHWWFRDQLTVARGHVTTVNGRVYQLQYFDRKQ